MNNISKLEFNIDCIVVIKKFKVDKILSLKQNDILLLDLQMNSNSKLFLNNEEFCNCKIAFYDSILKAKIFLEE